MSELLIIRLPSEDNQTIHWLIWSDSEKEIIGSGELENAVALTQLSEKSQLRRVVCLVPGVDVTLKSVEISGNLTRQMEQALPYMLEDDLASDVDKIHFSVIAKETNLVEIAICFKSKIEMWREWLVEAEIICHQFIPEALTLPHNDSGNWQAVQLSNHWIIRESEAKAWSCESEMLDIILQLRLADNADQIIEAYTPTPENVQGDWQAAAPILPMQLLAEGCVNSRINLLTGQYKSKQNINLDISKWKNGSIAALILLTVSFGNLFLQGFQAEQKTELIKAEVENIYKKVFPSESALKYSRIQKKMKGIVSTLSAPNESAGLLGMLNDLTPVFESVPNLEVSTLKFDSKNQEMRLSVSTDSFQAFELFSTNMPSKYTLEQGALNNSKDRVSGALTVKVK